jgi:hypothetical protein
MSAVLTNCIRWINSKSWMIYWLRLDLLSTKRRKNMKFSQTIILEGPNIHSAQVSGIRTVTRTGVSGKHLIKSTTVLKKTV